MIDDTHTDVREMSLSENPRANNHTEGPPVHEMDDMQISADMKPQDSNDGAINSSSRDDGAQMMSSDEPGLDASKDLGEPDKTVVRLIEKANGSAGRLVNLLAKHFPSFRDETRFDGRKVRLMKRAQIFVADLWAAFNGEGLGAFDDIGHLTMFAGECSSVLRAEVL